MSIEQIWKELEADEVEFDALHKADLVSAASINPLVKLKHTIGISIGLAIFFNLLYLVLVFLISFWTFRLALVVIILSNVWITINSWRLYHSIDIRISPFLPLKQQLQTTLDNVKKWWRLQQRISLIVFPIACVGGYAFGLVIGSGKSLETFIANPYSWVKIAIATIIVASAGYWAINKAFKKAYGKQLQALEENLKLLNEQ
jgi:hypothetical protein